MRSGVSLCSPRQGRPIHAEPGGVAIAVHGDTEIRNADGLHAGKFFDLTMTRRSSAMEGSSFTIDGVGRVDFKCGEMIGLEADDLRGASDTGFFPSKPAPTSNTMAMAISITTRLEPIRRQEFPDEPRRGFCRPPRREDRDKRHVGTTENRRHAKYGNGERESAHTHIETETLQVRHVGPSCQWGSGSVRTRMSQPAKTIPSALPIPTSTNPSVANCRTNLAEEAPRAPRTAISCLRPSERKRRRLVTLTQAIRTTIRLRRAEPAISGRMSPTMTSVRGATAAPWSAIRIGILNFELRRDGFRVGQCGLDRGPVFEASDPIETMAASPDFARIRRVECGPKLRRPGGRKLKYTRKYADDGVGDAVEYYRLSQHVLFSTVRCCQAA